MPNTGVERISQLMQNSGDFFNSGATNAAAQLPAIPAAHASRPRLLALQPEQITRSSGLQTRQEFDPENDPEDRLFTHSVQKHGVTQPVLVYRFEDEGGLEPQYGLIAGHRRLAAALHTGLPLVPALLVPPETSQENRDLLTALENLQRRDLLPLEKAALIQRLVERYGYTQTAVAELVGLSKAQVSHLLQLLDAPADIQKALKTGKVGVRNARELGRLPETERKRALERVGQGTPLAIAIRELKVGNKGVAPGVGTEINPEDGTADQPGQTSPQEESYLLHPDPVHIESDAKEILKKLLGRKSAAFQEVFSSHVSLPPIPSGQRLLLAMIWLATNLDTYQALKAYQGLDQDIKNELEKYLVSLYRLSRISMQLHSPEETELVRRCLATSVRMFFRPLEPASGEAS
jgi:ParB/RepB/Spo0J family partition protein